MHATLLEREMLQLLVYEALRYGCTTDATYACCKLQVHGVCYSLGKRDTQKRGREIDARKGHNKRLWRETERWRESLLREGRT